MAKFNIVVCDCPYSFSDQLTMSETKRGAEANYSTLSIDDLKKLDIPSICADDALLALWVPSSLLQDGLDIMKAWGFIPKQTHIWIKTKQNPFSYILKQIKKILKSGNIFETIPKLFEEFSLENMLAFGMGRLFRNVHEIIIVGTKGKIYPYLKNKSQRSVHFYPATKHSTKPEKLQDMLEKMFPDFKDKGSLLEVFARRQRKDWVCIGNEINGPYLGEDIGDSIERLKNL
jgi:N6-adenosine-specific RNA methylase IME4